jgi:hypothetical protein
VRHHVEGLADLLRRRREDVDVAQVQLRLVRLDAQLQLGEQVGAGHAVDVVRGFGAVKPVDHGARRRDALLVALR